MKRKSKLLILSILICILLSTIYIVIAATTQWPNKDENLSGDFPSDFWFTLNDAYSKSTYHYKNGVFCNDMYKGASTGTYIRR